MLKLSIYFSTVLVITMILGILYSIMDKEQSPDAAPLRRPTRLQVLNASDILNLMTVVPWPMTGNLKWGGNCNWLVTLCVFVFRPDEPSDPWLLPGPSVNQTEDALYAGIKALGDKELLEEDVAEPELNTPSFRHQRAVSTSLTARVMAKRGYVENQATTELMRRL